MKQKKLKVYDTSQREGETLQKWYRRLAKVADQRLVRLEGYSHEKNFKEATEWAYKRAMRDIRHWSGENAKRFNTAPPKRQESLIAKINDIRTFIDAPSSTKEGITSIYIKRANKINELYGTKLEWQDVGDFFESELWKKRDSVWGSKTYLETIATAKSHEAEIVAQIEEKQKMIKFLEEEDIEELKKENPWAEEEIAKQIQKIKDTPIHLKGETAYTNVMINKLLAISGLTLEELFET